MRWQQFKFPLRLVLCYVALTMLLGSMACTDTGSDRKRREWKVGYWYWQGRGRMDKSAIDKDEVPIELLYVNAGEYRPDNPYTKQASIDMSWPEYLPKADAYFAVLRCEGSACTERNIVPSLVGSYESLKRKTMSMGEKLVGLQIDYDCPTKDLDRYSGFLRDLRRALHKEDLLSITALLDWFSPGTKVADVIRWADEFVPQFYDVDFRKFGAPDGGIAEPIDPAKWVPIFNAYRKPYRIGIASFGRIVQGRKTRGSRLSFEASEELAVRAQSPLEIMACDKGMFVRYGSTTAGEIIAHYKGTSAEMIKMVIPTQQSVSSAYNAAKAMGGFCSGVIFFRHQVGNEALALSPAEISRMISGSWSMQETATVEADDGFCAAVSCRDLFVRLKDRFPPKNLVLVLRGSQDLEYFVPDRLIESRLRGPNLIEVTIPAYAGVPRIPIGRAVSRDPVRFTVEERS